MKRESGRNPIFGWFPRGETDQQRGSREREENGEGIERELRGGGGGEEERELEERDNNGGGGGGLFPLRGEISGI